MVAEPAGGAMELPPEREASGLCARLSLPPMHGGLGMTIAPIALASSLTRKRLTRLITTGSRPLRPRAARCVGHLARFRGLRSRDSSTSAFGERPPQLRYGPSRAACARQASSWLAARP